MLKFLYIKYFYEYKDVKKLISKKDKIKKKIEIYTEDEINREENKEQNLQNEDFEDVENEEYLNQSSTFDIPKLLTLILLIKR